MRINNHIELKRLRQKLRNESTKAEQLLWQHLKQKQIGHKIRRQHSVGPYVIDFYCAPCKLAIELDGAHHFTKEGMDRDIKRAHYLNEFGIEVIRFENDEVFENLTKVLEEIKRVLDARARIGLRESSAFSELPHHPDSD